jgi:hypothetical protein
MAGVDLLTLKDLSGWTTLAMVTRYAHLLLGRPREGVERLVTAPPPSASRNQPEIARATDTATGTSAPALAHTIA